MAKKMLVIALDMGPTEYVALRDFGICALCVTNEWYHKVRPDQKLSLKSGGKEYPAKSIGKQTTIGLMDLPVYLVFVVPTVD